MFNIYYMYYSYRTKPRVAERVETRFLTFGLLSHTGREPLKICLPRV